MNQKIFQNDFAVFILSHKRPNNPTYNSLKISNYTGNYFFILDDLDPTISEYEKMHGKEHILIFNKKEVAKRLDLMDNFEIWNSGMYARNACFDLAKKIGITYFFVLDDDYKEFYYRMPNEKCTRIYNMDSAIKVSLEYFIKNKNILSLCWCQGSDTRLVKEGLVSRKGMNAFFHSVNRPATFNGHMNDDVNTYTRRNQLGDAFIMIPYIQLIQEATQTKGGAAEMYKRVGTYQKSFYSVMQCPSFVKVSTFSKNFTFSKYRLHHFVESKFGYAQIISSKYKK
jgi:hypothetical protein